MIGYRVGRVTGRVDKEGGTINASNHVGTQRLAFALALLLLLLETTKLNVTAGAGIGTIHFGVAHSGGAVGGFETHHTLDLCEVVSSFSAFSFFNIVHTLTHSGAALNDSIKLFTKEASSNPDHRDTDCRDVADAHEDEEDGLLTSVGCTDVDGDEPSDGHGGYADEESIDEFDVGLAVAGIEDAGCDERREGEDDDVDSEEVEVPAAPTTKGTELRAGSGCLPAGGDASEHVGWLKDPK